MMSMVSGAVSQLRNVAGRAFASMVVALAALFIAAALPGAAMAQTITSSSGSPDPVIGSGQTVTFVVNFDSGNRVVTSISVDSILGVTYNCTGGIGNGQTNQSVVCSGAYVTTASDVSATQIQERPTVRLNANGTPITVVGSIITVAVQSPPATPDVSIAVSPASVSEDGATNLTYTVTRSASSASALIVNLTTSGTATFGNDYTGAAATVTIPANATTETVTINPIVDGTVEANETVTLTVASGSGYTVGSPSSATGTILNDDVPSATISVSPAAVAEDGAPNLIYTVTLNQASLSTTSINYTIGGTAANGTDYATIASPLVIAAGNTTGTVTVNPTADATIEANETVTLTLAAGSGYSVSVPNSATGTILNDDLPNLTINDVSLNEGNSGTTNFTFTVSLNAPAGPGGVTFNIATANGAATAGTDYTAQSLTSQTIPAGSSTYTFTALVSGDTTFESNETFFVNVTSVINAIVVDGQGVGTIVNDDAATPTVTAISPTSGPTSGGTSVVITGTNFTGVTAVTFGATAASSMTVNSTTQITATAPAGAAGTVDVTVTTGAGTSATSAADQFTYLAPPVITGVSPDVGPTSGGTSVTLTGTNLSGATAVSFGGVAATGFTVVNSTTITATAPAAASAGAVTVSVVTGGGTGSIAGGYTYFIPRTVRVTAPASITEGDSGFSFSTWIFSLDAPSSVPIIVGYRTVAGTATSSVDYGAQTSSLTIPAGSSGVGLNVFILGDLLDEEDETFSLEITSVSAGGLIHPTAGIALGVITDNDATPSLSVNDVTLTEGNAGTTNMTFTVSLSAASGRTVTVNYATADGTASAPGDYASGSGALTFNPGASTQSVTVAINGDTTFEANETLFLNLTTPVNATISDGQGVGTITNDDVAPPAVAAISPAAGPVGGGTTVIITGTNLSGATAVTFGATAATGFTVDSATQITATSPAGSGTVDVRVTTAGGTSPTTAADQYTYVAAPSAPVTLTPANGALTSDSTPTYSGTAGAGLTVNVIVDGTTIGTTTADGAGNWTFTPSVALADGSHTIRATADNAGGTSPSSNTNTFTVDATAPAAPVVSTPANGSSTNQSTPAYIGTAEPNATVTIIVDGSPIGTTGANASGNWGFSQVTPLSPGSHTVRATATDAAGNTSVNSNTNTFSYVPVSLPGGALAGGQVGSSYSASVTASGGTAPYTYAVTGGALPAGITLSTGGALSGAPTASGTYNFQVTATDSTSLTATGAYSITVGAPPAPDADPETSTVTSTGGTQGIDLSGSVSGAASIQIVSPPAHGTATVSGFTVNYTPQPGYFGPVTFTYSAVGYSDGSTPGAVSAPATVTITIPDPVLALPGGALPGATVATSYSHTFSASGGTAPYTYAVTAGALPTGLTLSTGGVLSGTPTAGGPFSFSVTATDSSTGTGPFQVTGAYSLTVAAPTIVLNPATLTNATVAVSGYSQAITASGGVGTYSYAVTAGALPAGMSLSTAGVLSGTPTAGGSFNFTVTATDQSTGAGPYSGSQAYTLTVNAAAIVVTPTTVAAGTRGFAYSQTFSATGGVGSYAYAVSAGVLPPGLTLSTAGALSGTPTATGSFNFTVRATDQATGSGPYSGDVSLTLVVNAATLTVTPANLPGVMAGVAYNQQLASTGGSGAVTYAVTAGALPTGMTMTSAGRISGTSYQVGTASFTVTATDAFGNTGSVPLRIQVQDRPNPAQDPDVRGLDTAQAEATRRLASVQIDNFSRRLEDLHNGGGNGPAMSNGLTLNAGVTDLGSQADQRTQLGGGRMFDQARIDPDRAELNSMLWSATDQAMTTTGGSPFAGLNAGSGKASMGGQPSMNAAPMQSDGAAASGVRFWTGGAITVGERDGDTGQAKFSVRSTGISMGVDFALAPNFDLGFGGGFGEESADIGSADSSVDSKQFAGVAYASFRPMGGVYLDGMLGYGSLEFDMQRRVVADGSLVLGEREGTATFGSIALGFEQAVSIGHMNAYGRIESLDATLDAYTETGSLLWALSYAERDVESLQGVLGARYVWSHEARDSTWTPSFRFEYRREFADGGIQNLQYADWLSGPTYQIQSSGWDRSELSVGFGLNVTTADGWKVMSELGARSATNQTAGTLRLTLSKAF